MEKICEKHMGINVEMQRMPVGLVNIVLVMKCSLLELWEAVVPGIK